MAKKKPLSHIELKHELENLIWVLEASTRKALARIVDLDQYEHSGSVNKNELAELRSAGVRLRTQASDRNGRLARARRDLLGPRKKGEKKPTKTALKTMLKDLREDLKSSEALHKTLDEREEEFRKYNLPKRITDRLGRSLKPLEVYLEKLGEYVRVTWKEPAKDRELWEIKSKSLVDWIVDFDKSKISTRSSASREMRDGFNEIGSLISRFLVEYFLMISDSFKEDIDESLNEIEAVIRCLTIQETSAVIDGFVALVEFCREKIHQAKGGFDSNDDDHRVKKGPRIERENDLFHRILLEIMKMEVIFENPEHSPLDRVFLEIANDNVYKDVFKDKLEGIGAEIRRMKIESWCSDKDPRTEFYEQVLYLGVSDVWKDLDLKKAKDVTILGL